MFSNLWLSWIASVDIACEMNHRSSSRRARSWRIFLRSLKNPRKFQNPLKEVQTNIINCLAWRDAMFCDRLQLSWRLNESRIRTYLNERHKDVDVLSFLSFISKRTQEKSLKTCQLQNSTTVVKCKHKIRKCDTSTSLCMRAVMQSFTGRR